MCGRFCLTRDHAEIVDITGAEGIEPFPPRYNIGPTQPILTITRSLSGYEGGQTKAQLVRWGFLPSWAKDPKEFSLLINARSETASQKPSFRNAMRHRRALIPASGFYEWHRPSDKTARKQPYYIRPSKDKPVFFAGLVETWHDKNGSEIDTGCILTVKANKALFAIHHRMPVVIEPGDFNAWLDCTSYGPAEISHLMKPAGDDFFEAVPVSDAVNKLANTGPDIQREEVTATDAGKDMPEKNDNDQYSLFD